MSFDVQSCPLEASGTITTAATLTVTITAALTLTATKTTAAMLTVRIKVAVGMYKGNAIIYDL